MKNFLQVNRALVAKKNFTQVNRALAAEKNFNLIEMLQGCSKRNGTAVYASNPDGQPTVNRQSRLMLHQGKRGKKGEKSSTCLRSSSDALSFRSRLDCVSIVSRQSDLDHVRGISAFSHRVWRYAAMITLLLTLACGEMWGADFTVNSSTTSSDALFSVSETMTNYTYDTYWKASDKLIEMATSSSITITNVTGATITAISVAGVADNNSNKTVNFTGSDGTTSAVTSSGSWNNRKSSSLTSKALNSTNVNKFKCGAGQTYTMTNNASSSYNAGVRFVITYTSTLPTSLTNGATTENSQAVSWTAPSTAPANGYLVAYSTSSTAPGNSVTSTTGSYTVAAIAAGTTSTTISGLSESTTYYWWVRSKNARGNSSWVAGSSFTTDAAPAGSTWYVKGGWNSWGTTDNLTGSGTELSATVNITTAGLYEFKIWNSDGDTWYGNTGNIGCNVSGWTFSTGESANCKFFASETGNYTFTFNTSTKALSVTYPTAQGKYYYKNTNSWGTVAVYRFKGGINNGGTGTIVTETETVCGDTYYFTYADPGTTLIFNCNSWDCKTGDMTASGNAGKYVSGTGSSWNTFTTYTISYAANGGGGSMSSETGICPSGSQVLTSNAFSAPSGCASFSHWTANVDVTANGTPVTAGNPIADGATLSGISSDITLTAVWKLSAPTITKTPLYNTFTISGSMAGSSYKYSTDGTTPTTAYSSAVAFDAAITAKAIATKSGYADSDVASLECSYINCSISSCGNATLTYTINGSTSVNNTAANLVSATNASNTTALGVPAASSAVTLSTMEFDGDAGKAVAKANGCYTTSLIMSSKLSVHNGSSFNTSHYLQFAFTVKDGYTFTPCDIQFVVQPTTYSTDFRWEITDGTSTYGYGTASGVGTGSDAGATVLTGLTSPSMMSAGTYYIRLYPKFKKDGKTNYFRIGDEVILKGTTAAAACTAPTTVDVSATVNSVSGYWFYPGDAIVLTATPTGSPAGSPVTYQWANGGVDIVGATSSTYSIASATTADAGNYTCTISYGACSTTSAEYGLKCMQFYLKNSSGSDISNHVLVKEDATHASLTLELTGGTTYKFRVTDGCGDWYGNTGEMTSSSCTDWTMPHDADCRVTTNSTTGDYTFLFDFTDGLLGSEMKVSVVYPGGDQASGKTIYWDNSVLNWAAGDQWYRIGTKTGNTKTQMTLVPGTANLYKVTTGEYIGFQNWHIANNEGEGTGNVFWTKDSDPTTDEEITAAMAYDGVAVTDVVTVTPISPSSHATGATSDNDNCEFYPYSKTYVMKTDNVTISDYSNGTVTVAYTDTEGDPQSFTSGNRDLAHTVILTVTAVPNTGYNLSALTVGGDAHTSGNTYTCSGNTTVAATFAANTYTVTLNNQSATTAGTANVTATYNASTNLTSSISCPAKTGYTFGGYYTETGGHGLQLINSSGDWNASVTGYTDASKNWIHDGDVTLYARWIACTGYSFHSANSGAYPWPSTCFTQVGSSHVWQIENFVIPSETKYYVGYQEDFWSADLGGGAVGEKSKSEEKLWTATPSLLESTYWDGAMFLVPASGEADIDPGDFPCGQATGAKGTLLITDNVRDYNLYVRFKPNGYGLTYAAGVKAFSYVSDHLWQTDIVTLTAADVAGTFKVGLATASAGTYVDCAMTSAYDDDAMNAHKNVLVSGQSYPAIPDMAAGQEGRFVMWDNSDGDQWYLSFLPVYTVQYDGNGSDGGSAPAAATKYRTNETPATLANTYTRTGYTFNGWNTAENGSGASYAAGANLAKIGANVTLYAQWTVNNYDLTWNLGGGTTSSAGTGIASGVSVNTTSSVAYGTSLTAPTVTKTGYNFSAWSPSVASTMPAEAVEYTATWTAKTTTITIDANTGNHGSTTPGTVTATWGSALPSFTAASGASGYSLTGYWTAATGGNKIINADGTLVASTSYADGSSHWNSEAATLTLYAQYEQVFTVTFNSNGGDPVAPISQATTGASITMPAAPSYDSDHTFQGWVIGGTTYAAGASYTPTANITAYATWHADCSAGGGSTTLFNVDFTDETTEEISTANSGATFVAKTYDGYNMSFGVKSGKAIDVTNGTGVDFKSNNFDSYQCLAIPLTLTKDNEVTAVVTLHSSGTVKYKWVSGSLPATPSVSSPSTYSPSSATNTLTYTPSSAGNYVLYLGRSGSGNGSQYIESIVITQEGGVGTCYYVTYDGNGAESGSISDATAYASGGDVTVLDNTGVSAYTKAGYTFMGWNTEDDGSGTPYDADDKFSISGNVTLYAQWSDGSAYTLTWDANGGSDGACTGTCTSGSVASGTTLVAPEDPTLSNYTFDGWNTANDGSGSAAAATMPAANTTYYAAWKQTVTLTTGAQGEGGNQTPYVYLNGTGVSSFTAHTASGYTLQGYYTAGSGGTKVLNADGTFASANVTDYITSSKWSRTGAAPTLFAQWLAAEDCSTSDFVIKKGSSTEYQGCMESTSYDGTATSFTAGSATTVGNAKMTISHYSSGITRPGSGKVFSIVIEPVSGYYLKSICWAGKVENDETVSYYWDNNSGSATTITPQTTSGTGVTYDAPNSTTTKFTASYTDDGDSKGGIWWRNVQVEVCAGGGTTYNVTYDGNDETGGSVPTDATDYSYGGTVTVIGNTGSLVKTNYTFAGWATNDDGTGSSYVADNTFSITANTTLYAKWTQAVTFDANTANHGSTGGSATAVWNATGLTGITHATPASGYKLLGYYTAATGGTKVLNSDGTFAASTVTDYITSGKWSRTGAAATLYAQYESAGALTWNLGVNTSASSLTTDSKSSAFTEISNANMTNAALEGGLSYDKSQKANLTGTISTTAAIDNDKYVKVTFQVASGYKFIPSKVSVKVQPVSTNKSVKLVLEDNASHSITYTTPSAKSAGSISTIEMTNGSSVEFTGTVTLKIYCYGATDKYRLGTPITIDGDVEATCATMPSYTSMSYTTTSFLPDADASGAPITIVGGDNIDAYQWKYNTVNDRTSGTNCGTGTSLTPLTDAGAATDVTRYYWCEMTNDACGITIKSPAVAITVAAAKSDATVTWTNPASTPNYGGGGYTIKATVDQTAWDGNAADLVITAPAGVRIYNVSSGTDGSSRKYVQADFDVQTAFDRTTYANIPFTVSAAATATYNAISDAHNVSYSACAGDGEGSSYNIRVRKAYTKGGPGNNYYYWDNTDGWISSPSPNSSIGSAKASSTMATVFDSVSNTNAEAVYVRTYHNNIKKVRIYADFRANNMTITNVYKHNDFYTANSKYAVDYSVVYNGDEENEDLGTAAQGYVDITLSDVMMAANDILLVKFNTSRVRPLGAVITESSAGSINTGLTWSSGTADGGSVTGKTQSSANFTITATRDAAAAVSLGAITYSSSNTSCATVNATTGEVTITASGESDLSTTIKATLAASGCYKKKEITYTLTIPGVTCTIEHGTLTSDVTSKCSTADATLTLTDFESGATIQWYNGESTISNGATYAITTEGTTSTLVTKEAGTYSVMVTSATCSDRSNSITISNVSAEASVTNIVDKWYVKNGRLTPAIELWTLSEGASLKSVAWSPANATGLTCFDRDGIIYLEGKEPSSNESGADIVYTLTATITDACGDDHVESSKTITITHQKNTDKHVLAFVVRGADKGGFTEGIEAAQTTEVGLYNALTEYFDVQATNMRASDDEKALKEYYSQFDILCITDYPDTKKDKGVNGKSCVDAIGALIDIRPILTMEAWVSGLTNWKAKGISGSPSSPTTRQYDMLLQCKDHEIFAGTDLTKIGEGDETMYQVDMVDNTLEDYATLDATYGAGAHEEDKNYQYGKKPALQGFTFSSEMEEDGLLPIGLIDDGAGNDLQVGIERQTEMEARLMVLGINSYGMERLTDDGQTVVINALKYLLKKNAEDIADCSISFVGGAEDNPKSWRNPDNWIGGTLPIKSQKVRILADCELSGTTSRVASVMIVPDGKYNHGSDNAAGKLTIKPDGALIVTGKVQAATAPYYNKPRATETEHLIIGSSESDEGNGTLIFKSNGTTQATVEMYSKASNSSEPWSWQYVAVPFNDNSSAYRNYYGSWLYRWAEDNSGWEIVPDRGEVYPWVGYCLTQDAAKKYVMDGTLVATTEEQVFEVPAGKNLVVGNSWTAPIQVKQFTDDDFANMSKNIYLFNTGSDEYGTGTFDKAEGRYEGGTYVTVPIHAAPYTGDGMISSLQAFIVYATSDGGGGRFTLDYKRHVRPESSSDVVLAGRMHAPNRTAAREEKPVVLKMWASGTRFDDRLVVLERSDFSAGEDAGWDGNKRLAGNASPLLYAVTDNGKDAVAAIPEMEGLLVGFWAGEDSVYTMHFEYDEDDALYLLDTETNTYTPVNNDSRYTFFVPDKDAHTRFVLTRRAPQIGTGVENVQSGEPQDTKAFKFLKDDKIYIFVNGILYDVTGKVVK